MEVYGFISPNFIPQYLAVLAGFAGLMFVWPRVVFAGYLRNKPKHYQFFFCICSMFVICSLVTVLLGVIGILNQVAMCIVFYGIFAGALVWHIIQFIRRYKTLGDDEYIDIPVLSSFMDWWYDFKERFKKENRNPGQESPYIDLLLNIFLVFVIGALIFHFGEIARMTEQYGFIDMKAHEAWAQQLINGQLFPDGVYTFGMHFIMTTLCQLFGENIFFVNLYIGNIAAILFMIALFFLLKKVFKTKVAIVATFALLLIVCTAVTQFNETERMVYDGMHRFRWNNAQEFCMFATLIAPLCVNNFLNGEKRILCSKNVSWLILFGLSVAVVLSTYFQTLIILLIFSIAMILVCIKFRPMKLLGLGAGLLGGAVAAAAPLSIAFAKVQNFNETFTMELNSITGQQNTHNSAIDTAASNPDANGLQTFWNDVINVLFHKDYTIIFLAALIIGLAVFVYSAKKRPYVLRGYGFALIAMVMFFVIFASPAMNWFYLISSCRIVMPLFVCISTVCSFAFDLLMDTTSLAPTEKDNTDSNKNKKSN